MVLVACALAACGGADDRPSAAPPTGSPWLVDVTREAGLDFTHDGSAAGAWAIPEIMAGGAAMFDADGDGTLDLYLTNGAANAFYRQRPDGTFARDPAAGLDDTGYGMGVAVGDFDRDGAPDVYVTNLGDDRLYRNDGAGRFVDVTAAAGIAVSGWSTSAAFVDFDQDGWLDVYVARYVRHEPDKRCPDSAGRPNYCGPSSFEPEHDVLLRNLGNGRFEDVSVAAGLHAARGAGLGVVVADLDDDGWPDIYVANDGYANQMWINRAGQGFSDDALLAGAALDMHGRAEAGMGVLAADLDTDGDLDLFMTHLANETNTWYRNRGPGRGFEDASATTDLGNASLGDTGFGTAAVDMDLDGDLDVLVANGRVSRTDPRDDSTVDAPWNLFAEPNRLFVNDGDGRFAPAPAPTFTVPVEVSRALAYGDIDNDGDVDFLLANVGSAARLYRNDAERSGHWLRVRAIDPRHGGDALGAQVTVVGDGRRLVRAVQPASGYLTSNDPRLHFGLGGLTPERLEVRWPDGAREAFAVDGVDIEVRVERGRGSPVS